MQNYVEQQIQTGANTELVNHKRGGAWSIGVLNGADLFNLSFKTKAVNPIVTAAQVTDRQAGFVADPFGIKVKDRWYLFFEVFDQNIARGVIAYATSPDGINWSYEKVVLQEPFHLSYPFIFEEEGEIYMMPETKKAREVRLYRAIRFPDLWQYDCTLLRGRYADATLIKHANRWWLFASHGAYSLAIKHAAYLRGPWRPHLRPWIYLHDKGKSRPGGRIVNVNGNLIRFAQDNRKHYGHQLRAFVIDVLTPWRFREHEISAAPFLTPGVENWNSFGMHHIDPHFINDQGWLAFVDGTN